MIHGDIAPSAYFNKPTIVKYCDGLDYAIEDVKKELDEAIRDFNGSMTGISASICTKESSDNIYIALGYRTNYGTYEKNKMEISRKSFEKFSKEFNDTIELMVDGVEAVYKFNNLVRESQTANGAIVAISYKWSLAEGVCQIYDWDYDKIKVRLSKEAVSKLARENRNNRLEEIAKDANWSVSIKEFIESFNTKSVHCDINAVLGTTDLESALTENMLDAEDVISLIQRNKGNTGTQSIKSISVIKELGRFIVICKWIVDYSKKKLSMQIMGDKVFDAETGRFINERDIINRVEQRVNIPEHVLNMLFEKD